MTEICRTCAHCVPSKADMSGGECHLEPPKVFLLPAQTKLGQPVIQKMSGYPPVKLDDSGCGKYKASAEILG